MKNFQKTIIAWLAFVALSVTSFANAEIVTSKTHSDLYAWSTQCDWGTFDQVMYAGSSRHEMVDTFGESNTSYVWEFDPTETYVSTYNKVPNAISMPTLSYFSQWKPHNVSTVVVMWSKEGASITSDLPSNYKRSDVAAQVVYHVSRFGLLYEEWDDNEMLYLDYNKLWLWTQKYKYSFNFDAEILTHEDNECLNIHIWFCWDWILDNSTNNYSTNVNSPLNWWEECDPNDPNKTWWGDGWCSSSCKLTDKKVYDLALTKKLNDGNKTYKLWDTVVYKITIYNQGNLTAKNIEITDYIPDGLILNDDNWTQKGSKATRVIES